MPARTAFVDHILEAPGSGKPLVGVGVTVRTNTPTFTIDGTREKVGKRVFTSDSNGLLHMELEINSDLDPPDSSWQIQIPDVPKPWSFQLTVTQAGQTVTLRSVLVPSPTNPAPIQAGVSLTQLDAEASARQSAVTAEATARAAGDAAAVSTAAADASTKASAAQAAAISAAATDAATKAGAAQSAAVATAATDATGKANAAQAAAIAAAAADATSKDDAVKAFVASGYVPARTTPPDHTVAMGWLDSSSTPPTLKVWDGSVWVLLSGLANVVAVDDGGGVYTLVGEVVDTGTGSYAVVGNNVIDNNDGSYTIG